MFFYVITNNTRISFHKAHLYKSIRSIFTCEKKPIYIQPIRMAYRSFTCWSITNNDNVKAFPTQSESCIVYIQIAFQI